MDSFRPCNSDLIPLSIPAGNLILPPRRRKLSGQLTAADDSSPCSGIVPPQNHHQNQRSVIHESTKHCTESQLCLYAKMGRSACGVHCSTTWMWWERTSRVARTQHHNRHQYMLTLRNQVKQEQTVSLPRYFHTSESDGSPSYRPRTVLTFLVQTAKLRLPQGRHR